MNFAACTEILPSSSSLYDSVDDAASVVTSPVVRITCFPRLWTCNPGILEITLSIVYCEGLLKYQCNADMLLKIFA